MEALPWWPAWQASAKAILQYLHNQGHRTFLQQRIRQRANGQDVDGWIKDLQNTVERFAKWRWDTLDRAVKSFVRVESAVIIALSGIRDLGQLQWRDAETAKNIAALANSEAFWGVASDLATSIKPCDCHEEERMRGQAVQCKWAGRRAKSLSSRLESLQADFLALRDLCQSHLRPHAVEVRMGR